MGQGIWQREGGEQRRQKRQRGQQGWGLGNEQPGKHLRTNAQGPWGSKEEGKVGDTGTTAGVSLQPHREAGVSH